VSLNKKLIASNLVDVIHSPDMHDVARLFAPPMQAYGRAIVMVRHPIARAVAKYQWLRQSNAEVKEMTLEEFVMSGKLQMCCLYACFLLLKYCDRFVPMQTFPFFVKPRLCRR